LVKKKWWKKSSNSNKGIHKWILMKKFGCCFDIFLKIFSGAFFRKLFGFLLCAVIGKGSYSF
jgi:hypothetical protein